MRGLASILLVLIAAVAIISLAGVYSTERERNLETSSYALELERAYYAKLDFKHSVMQAFAQGAKSEGTREDKAKNAAAKLSELYGYLKKNKNAELWCGVISSAEFESLPKKISEKKGPVKCNNCWDAKEKTVFVNAYPEKKGWTSYKCLSFIDVDSVSKTVRVSRGGLSLTQDPELAVKQFDGKFVFGVSYYDELTGVGSVAIVPEGTWAGYE